MTCARAGLGLVWLLAAASVPALVLAGQEPFQAAVIGVADGDTVTVLHHQRPLTVRLQGIDETGRAFGRTANRFTSELVFGKSVPVQLRATDRHGRRVADVAVDEGSSERSSDGQGGQPLLLAAWRLAVPSEHPGDRTPPRHFWISMSWSDWACWSPVHADSRSNAEV